MDDRRPADLRPAAPRSGRSLASPAVDGTSLFIHTEKALYRISGSR